MDLKNLCMGCMEEKGSLEVCPICSYSEAGSKGPSIFLRPRTVLVDKYLIGRPLGQGGFGITYLAWDINLDIKIAVKEFFPQGLVSRGPTSKDVVSFSGDVRKQFEFGLERFLHEARTLARFANHPNIVTVRDFFRANGTAYMVMNYIEGMTLEEYLEKEGGKISFQKTLDIMMPVLDALKEVHLVGIIHRDISPDNIFIDASGRVVLIDFGAARQEMQQKSRGLSVIMKAGYAPEEQYRTRGEQGPWTDVYAAAATMYRSITGQVPLESLDRMAEDLLVPPSELGADIEPHQEQVLLKALALRAEDRYRKIEEFQDSFFAKKAAGKELLHEQVSEEKLTEEIDQTTKEKEKTEVSSVTEAAPVDETDIAAGKDHPKTINKKVPIAAAAGIFGLILLGLFFFSNGAEEEVGADEPVSEADDAIEEINGEKEDEEADLDYGTISWNDGTYKGELKNNRPHGEGMWAVESGSRYEGEWKNGMEHGYGTYTWVHGDVYEGEWKEGERTGEGTYTWDNGDVYEGEWKEGERTGEGTYTWGEDSDRAGDRYEGEWKDDIEHGYGIYTWANGDVYEGKMQEGEMHGYGTYTWANGDVYEGEFQESMQHGYGIFTWGEGSDWAGDRYEGEWKQGERAGKGTYTWADGSMYEGEFQENMKHGYGTLTFADGEKLEGRWEYGEYID